jgi:hypothetical protein
MIHMARESMKETTTMPNDILVEQIAEGMAIYAGSLDAAAFMPQAQQLLRSFVAIEGRPPADYLEIEKWSMRRVKSGRFLMVK